jgi:hypothetical protein
MKQAAIIIPLLTALFTSSATAQNWSQSDSQMPFTGIAHAHVAPVQVFARYTFQPQRATPHSPWQIGLAFNQLDNHRPVKYRSSDVITPGQSVIELRFDGANSGIWSSGTNGHLIAAPGQEVLNASKTKSGLNGVSQGLLIGGAILGGIVIVAALSPDKDPLTCAGNTVPNPIAGTCEPLR